MSIKDLVEQEKLKQAETERQINACCESMRRVLLSELEQNFQRFKVLYTKELKPYLNALKNSKAIDYLTELRKEYHLTFEEGKPEVARLQIIAKTSDDSYRRSFCWFEINPITLEFLITHDHHYESMVSTIDSRISYLDFKPYLNRLKFLQIGDFPELKQLKKDISDRKFESILSVSASLTWDYSRSGSGEDESTHYKQITVKLFPKTYTFGGRSWEALISSHDPWYSSTSSNVVSEHRWKTNAIQSAIAKSYFEIVSPRAY